MNVFDTIALAVAINIFFINRALSLGDNPLKAGYVAIHVVQSYDVLYTHTNNPIINYLIISRDEKL